MVKYMGYMVKYPGYIGNYPGYIVKYPIAMSIMQSVCYYDVTNPFTQATMTSLPLLPMLL